MTNRRRQPVPPPPSPSTNHNAHITNNDNDRNDELYQLNQWSPHRLLNSSFQTLGTPEQVKKQFVKCLLSSTKTLTSIVTILLTEQGKTSIFDYSVPIDIHDFISIDPVLGNMILRFPSTLLPLLEESIVMAQKEILDKWMDIQELDRLSMMINGNCDTNLAAVQQQQQPNPFIKEVIPIVVIIQQEFMHD